MPREIARDNQWWYSQSLLFDQVVNAQFIELEVNGLRCPMEHCAVGRNGRPTHSFKFMRRRDRDNWVRLNGQEAQIELMAVMHDPPELGTEDEAAITDEVAGVEDEAVVHGRPQPPFVQRPNGQETCFDAYIMIDWNSNKRLRPTNPTEDSPWLAEGYWNGNQLVWWQDHLDRGYFRSRRTCINHVLKRLQHHVDNNRRVLLGFDFAYGYPSGFGVSLGVAGPGFWNSIWGEISAPTAAPGVDGAPPPNNYATANNHNNRFEVASFLNQRVGRHQAAPQAGPFYGGPVQFHTQYFNNERPLFPFAFNGGSLREYRITEMRLREQGLHPLNVWWVSGGRAPTVGGQVLTGIPAVREIRTHNGLGDISQIWPFETGFTSQPTPSAGPFIVHAEIWPGIVNDQLQQGLINDEAQVRAMVKWAADLDAQGLLGLKFDEPDDLTVEQVGQCTTEEGWILGA